MAEFERQDFISDEALQAPHVLKKNMEDLLKTMNDIRKAGMEFSSSFKNVGAGGGASIKKMSDEAKKLAEQNKQLTNVQNQLAAAIAKDTDEYRKYEEQLKNVRQELKEKNALGERDALTMSKQNSSLIALTAALNKNRVAYAKLTSEEQRNSKAGRELISVIQKQDQEVKDLRKSMGQHQDNVGNYASAVEGLGGKVGGVVSNLKNMGSQLMNLVKSPAGLAIAALVGLFLALKSAVTLYFDATVEGQERLKKQESVWDSFFLTLKKGWANVGESVVDFFGDNGLKGVMIGFLAWVDNTFGSKLLTKFVDTEQKGQKLAASLAKLWKAHMKDVVDDAATELAVNKLLEDSKNKLKFTDEERLHALREANKLLSEQLEGDIKLAQDDINAQKQRIAWLGGVLKAGKSIKDMSDQEIVDIGVKQEEIEKLAELEAALLKVQSDASEKRKSLMKSEIALVEEIHKDKLKRAEDEAMQEYNDMKRNMDLQIQIIQATVIAGNKEKEDGDREINAKRKSMADDLINAQIRGLEKLLNIEDLTAEERKDIQEKLDAFRLASTQATYDEMVQITVESNKITAAQIIEAYTRVVDQLQNLFSSFTESRIQNIEQEQAALEERMNKELEFYAGNEEKKSQIKNEYERKNAALEAKKIQAQRRQAQFDKVISAVQAAIATALAVTRLLDKPPLAIAAGIAGAIQVAAILAKPIPAYAEGVEDSKEGLAIVGEKGSELMRIPGKGWTVTPDRPSLVHLPAHTKVIPNDESMRMMAMNAISYSMAEKPRHSDFNGYTQMLKGISSLEKTVRNKKEIYFNISSRGAEIMMKQAETRTWFLNEFYK